MGKRDSPAPTGRKERRKVSKGSRRKGHDFERQVASDLRQIYPDACRGYGQSRSGADVPDVDGTPFWVECKRGTAKYVSERKAFNQARENSDGRPPIAICKVDREETLVVMDFDTFLTLVAK